jgi:hypothetical protein
MQAATAANAHQTQLYAQNIRAALKTKPDTRFWLPIVTHRIPILTCHPVTKIADSQMTKLTLLQYPLLLTTSAHSSCAHHKCHQLLLLQLPFTAEPAGGNGALLAADL